MNSIIVYTKYRTVDMHITVNMGNYLIHINRDFVTININMGLSFIFISQFDLFRFRMRTNENSLTLNWITLYLVISFCPVCVKSVNES